jgi:2-alkyl-3-oxoalkanoate reductase
MKIIITGATGFVGGYLTRYFSTKGHEILAIGRSKKAPKRLLDFAKYQAVDWNKKIPNLEADLVIHAAALASDAATYADLYEANVEGTKRLAKATAACPNFVLISSSSVYAYQDNLPKKEADAGKNFDFLTDYGKTKWLSEQALLSNENPQQKRLILRPRAIYGIGDRVILPRLLNMAKGNYFIKPGAMNVQTSQTHIGHIADIINFFIINKNYENQLLTLNIGDFKTYLMCESIHQLLNTLTDKKLQKTELPIALIRLIAQLKISPKVTKFLVDAVTHHCVLDLSALQQNYKISTDLTLENEAINLKKWIDDLGGIKQYLKKINDAPWLI